ncbi:nucleotidyltransferase family protein [Luteimonas sp. 8-5]|uniref:nucleotidyltransferase family protein n=1 Tax=Luteimonas sp. 8-5 TaxID=3039387 RepID=UPI00243630C4|nr:nucleotidyltransferase family protein [Luteimonas sp. 8-5]MDG6349234.1 nucleotidyltransferase family protein [Luteimonas sp. 8-5]
MLPPLKTVEAGLHRATEALALELARPGTPTPEWDELQWRLASAAAAVHGIAPVLAGRCRWRNATWQRFLQEQHAHVEDRQQRIAAMLRRIDAEARAAGIAIVALKGSVLHAMGLYAPGERPMADIDLLVNGRDATIAVAILRALGYLEAYAQWKHQVFRPSGSEPVHGLGEHRDSPVNIELHVRIQERLPVSAVDVTEGVLAPRASAGLNDYPSTGALMAHLLLHAAGGMCSRSLRLMHLHDIALLCAQMDNADWRDMAACAGDDGTWWALPPLCMVDRYFPGTVPPTMLAGLARDCPPLLRAVASRQTITQVSCSELWLHPLAGLEWSRSAGDVVRYLVNRVRPTTEALRERADMMRTQLWLRGQEEPGRSRGRRMLAWLARPVPRLDMLYAVRASMEPQASP